MMNPLLLMVDWIFCTPHRFIARHPCVALLYRIALCIFSFKLKSSRVSSFVHRFKTFRAMKNNAALFYLSVGVFTNRNFSLVDGGSDH
jgi:hypothetical protein